MDKITDECKRCDETHESNPPLSQLLAHKNDSLKEPPVTSKTNNDFKRCDEHEVTQRADY